MKSLFFAVFGTFENNISLTSLGKTSPLLRKLKRFWKISFPKVRVRRLRKDKGVRRFVRNINFDSDDLIYPVFVEEGIEGKEGIEGLLG
ncbi:MAG: hypothetical protein ACLFUR_06395 [Candidatus Hadarchaeia archaeon]